MTKTFEATVDKNLVDTIRLFWTVTNEPENVLIRAVFVADYACSLPLDRIERVAVALFNLNDVNGYDLKKALTKLVKAKVLRSRMIRGQRHWEVNY